MRVVKMGEEFVNVYHSIAVVPRNKGDCIDILYSISWEMKFHVLQKSVEVGLKERDDG